MPHEGVLLYHTPSQINERASRADARDGNNRTAMTSMLRRRFVLSSATAALAGSIPRLAGAIDGEAR